jgi:hypothetical protein
MLCNSFRNKNIPHGKNLIGPIIYTVYRAGTRGRQAWQLPRVQLGWGAATENFNYWAYILNNNIFNISKFLALWNIFL